MLKEIRFFKECIETMQEGGPGSGRHKGVLSHKVEYIHKDKNGINHKTSVGAPVNITHDDDGNIVSNDIPSAADLSKITGHDVVAVDHPQVLGKNIKTVGSRYWKK